MLYKIGIYLTGGTFMKERLALYTAVIFIVVGSFTGVHGALIDAPVPNNAYITINGLDWAWASHTSDTSSIYFGVDLSFQSSFGWRIPSAEELASAPLATDFIFAGANVPMNGQDPVSRAYFESEFGGPTGDAALAVPYFNSLSWWGDWGNAPGSGGAYTRPWNSGGYAEFLVVRGSQQVPEPSSMLLIGLGIVGLAGMRRFRK